MADQIRYSGLSEGAVVVDVVEWRVGADVEVAGYGGSCDSGEVGCEVCEVTRDGGGCE